jgi:hypothetical protein
VLHETLKTATLFRKKKSAYFMFSVFFVYRPMATFILSFRLSSTVIILTNFHTDARQFNHAQRMQVALQLQIRGAIGVAKAEGCALAVKIPYMDITHIWQSIKNAETEYVTVSVSFPLLLTVIRNCVSFLTRCY